MNNVALDSAEAVKDDDFAQRAEQWLKDNVPAKWRDNRGALTPAESDAIRREWDKKLFEGGFAGITLPSEYGGAGLGLAEEIEFSVLAGKAQAPDGFGRIGKVLVAPMLIQSGTQDQQDRYLRGIISGEDIWCQGFSEPEAGSDLAGVKTRAVKVDGGWKISGRKTWTTFAQHAQYIFVIVQSDAKALRYKNLSMMLVRMDAPGVTVHDIQQISGATHFAETHFDNVFVSDEDVVGAPGEGWAVAMAVLGNERGGSETAARYVEIRSGVDLLLRTISDRPELSIQLNDLDIRTELLRWQLSKVVGLEEEGGEPFERAVSVLKVLWSELGQDVSELGLSVNVERDRPHWRYQYLESRAISIYSGTNEIQRNIISERVLGLPKR